MRICDCGNDFLLVENTKPGKITHVCQIRCRECGVRSWGVGLTSQEARDIARRRWESRELMYV